MWHIKPYSRNNSFENVVSCKFKVALLKQRLFKNVSWLKSVFWFLNQLNEHLKHKFRLTDK